MNATIAYLERVLSTHGEDSLHHRFARAKLDALVGSGGAASSNLEKLLREVGDRIETDALVMTNIAHIALLTQQLDIVADTLNRHLKTGNWFRIAYAERPAGWVTAIRLRIDGKSSALFTLGDNLRGSDRFDFVINRWLSTLPLFAASFRCVPAEIGEIEVNMEDHGVVPGLAFCDNRPEFPLIPDPPFLSSHGYQDIREHYERHSVGWDARKPVAFWRGATTGRMTDRALGWRSLPRIRLCEIARSNLDLFDAGISHVTQMPDVQTEEEIKSSGLSAAYVPARDFNKYRYQIDIDGNTNSWPGLFQKLLTGSPVLKVSSKEGFRQWYYDRLNPWVNFVPVAADMSDLIEKVVWLLSHDSAAQEIGQRGKALAYELSYEKEVLSGARIISAALRASSTYASATTRDGPHLTTRASTMTPASDMKQAVTMVRTAPLENLRSVQWLEQELIPALGFPKEAAPYLPREFESYCGIGLQSFQAPNQFAPYLRYLADYPIRHYLEIGVFEGGTFALTVEYLSRFGLLETAMGIDLNLRPNIVSYSKMRSEVKLVEGGTASVSVQNAIQNHIWDLVLIDGDHSEDGCWQDYVAVKDNARLVAFHDTDNDIAPGVGAVWSKIKSVLPSRSVREFHEQYFLTSAELRRRFFGIGVAQLAPFPRHPGET